MKIRREQHLDEGYDEFVFTPETKSETIICYGLCLSYCEEELSKLRKLLEGAKK